MFRLPLNYKLEKNGNNYFVQVEQENKWVIIDTTTTPAYVPVTQWFGANATPFYEQLGWKGHNGTDFKAPTGCKVYSIIDGTVSDYTEASGFLSIMSDETDWNGRRAKLRAVYGHSDHAVVKIGDKVKVGDFIAISDNKGQYTTGAHLHLQVMPYYKTKQPAGYNYVVNRQNGYDGAEDFTDLINTKIEYMPTLADQLEAEKVVQAWRDDFKKHHDQSWIRNSQTGEFSYYVQGILKTFKEEDKQNRLVLALTDNLFRLTKGASLNQADWDKLPKKEF